MTLTHPSTDVLVKTPMWDHQRRAFDFAYPRAAAMLAMEMGTRTGKSKVAIDVIVNRGHQRILILCPKSVVAVWPHQFVQHADHVSVIPLADQSVAEKQHIANEALNGARRCTKPTVIVVNYESAWRQPFHDWALKQEWDCVILDESHRIKAPGGKQSWFCKALARRARQRLCLTGTPMPHSPLDIYAQYRFLDTSIFGTSFTLFKGRYAIPHPVFPGQVRGFKNQDELQEHYQRIAFRVTKDEALDLPPFQHIAVPVALESKARRVYDDLEKDFWTSVESGEVTASNALVKLLRLQQVTGGFVMDDERNVQELGDEKRSALADILDDLPPDEPLVVFGRFRHDLDVVHAVAQAAGCTSAELSGRHNDLVAWQSGDARVLAVQIQAGGVGIDLTRARYCVYLSLGFSLGDYEQSLARVHRPGQDHSVTYLHLVAQRSVDEKVYATLRARKQVVEAILGERGR